MPQQPPVGHALLIIEDLQSHSYPQQSVGLLWMSDQLGSEISTWQYTTLTTEKHPYHRQDSNPQPQQASGRRTTPLTARPPVSAKMKAELTKFVTSAVYERRESLASDYGRYVPYIKTHGTHRDGPNYVLNAQTTAQICAPPADNWSLFAHLSMNQKLLNNTVCANRWYLLSWPRKVSSLRTDQYSSQHQQKIPNSSYHKPAYFYGKSIERFELYKTSLGMGLLLAAGLHYCYRNSLLCTCNPFSSICMRIFIFVNCAFSFAWWIGSVIYFANDSCNAW